MGHNADLVWLKRLITYWKSDLLGYYYVRVYCNQHCQNIDPYNQVQRTFLLIFFSEPKFALHKFISTEQRIFFHCIVNLILLLIQHNHRKGITKLEEACIGGFD